MLNMTLPLAVLLLFGFAPGADGQARPGPVAPTIGFFMDRWQPRTFVVPASREVDDAAQLPGGAQSPSATAGAATVTTQPPATAIVTIDADSIITRIPPTAYGHNANTWMGPMASQPTLMTNLANLHPNVIRWPAGSGSDGYFWNATPGSLPADVPSMVPDNSGKLKMAHWYYGQPADRHSASLEDYYTLLRETGNEGLITVNYGYARYGMGSDPVATAAHLAADWVRYDHGRTRYWDIGNENFGDWEWGYRIDTTTNHDGQPAILSGDLYGHHFAIFADSMRQAAAETGSTIYIGAVTYEASPAFWQPPCTKNWNAGMMRAIHDRADYYVVHNYFTPYNKNSSAAEILHDAIAVPGHMMQYIRQTLQESGAMVKPVAMDEWNMFAVGSRQQVSNTSGLFAVLVLGEAMRNAYGLAARWDLFNAWAGGNDHGLFSAGDEQGVQRWSPRPSFYYLYYLQRCMGDRLVAVRVAGDTSLCAYASTFSSGEIGAVLVNTGVTPITVSLQAPHLKPSGRYYWYVLHGGEDNGEFSGKVFVNGSGPDGPAGGPADYATIKANAAGTAHGIRITVPARGAVFLVVAKNRGHVVSAGSR
jgi:hypothetical protein